MLFFYERLTVYCLLFLLITLSLDHLYRFLPVTGYTLLLTNLVLIGFTTCATCYGIKWAVTSNKPLHMYNHLGKSECKILIIFLKKFEGYCRKRLKNHFCFESFAYPTDVDEQTRLLLKDIERDFIKIWYCHISQNPSFLFDSHLILEEICHKIIAKIKTLNLRNLILHILIIYLNHLQQYKKLKKKLFSFSFKILSDANKPKVEISDLYQFLHPANINDHIFNYYLKKITKSFLKEFAPQEFSNSLECKILSGIIGKKVLSKFLITLENPNWINHKLINLLNEGKHEQLLHHEIYTLKKKAFDSKENNAKSKKFLCMKKKNFPLNIFESSKNLCDNSSLIKVSSAKELEGLQYKEKTSIQNFLTWTSDARNIKKRKKENALYNLSSCAVDALPVENLSIQCQFINQIHKNLISNKKDDIFQTIKVPVNKLRNIEIKGNPISNRSRSLESLNTFAEINILKNDAIVKERLRENVVYSSFKKMKKTQSFDEKNTLNETLIKNEGISNSIHESLISECKKEVSPVYEEPEDFATTIAKLRSILQQRESNTLLLNKTDSPEDSKLLPTSLKKPINNCYIFKENSHDSSMECELPTDGRLFFNVSIPTTELINDYESSPYILYFIQYNRIYTTENGTYIHQQGLDFNNPQEVVQTKIIKRRFQDFLDLQTKLEENVNFKNFMKEVNGPKKYSNFYSSEEYQDCLTFEDKALLEIFLRQLCSNADISNSSELQEFLDYNFNTTVFVTKKNSGSSLQKLDKLFSNKFSGVFNSLKTVLPSFDFDASAIITSTDNSKRFQDQKLLPGFPSFGNKELLDQKFSFVVVISTTDSLVDDIRQFMQGKKENIEDAVDALNSTDWLSEEKECRFFSLERKCMWYSFKNEVLDDEFEPLDSLMPIYSLLLDIISELLQDSDCWIIKEPVIRLFKVVFGYVECLFMKELSKKNWNCIIGNIIRMLRLTFFQNTNNVNYNFNQNETDVVLKKIICDLMPGCIKEFLKAEDLFVGVSLFVDSFQISKLNRDILLRLFDLLIVRFLSCHHVE